MKPEEIDNLPSRPFKGFDWSVHASVSRLIDVIYGEYVAWYKGTGTGKRLKDPGKIKQHLTHFVLEAYRTYKVHPELTMGVHLGKKYYEKGDRYCPNHLSYRVVKNMTDFLVVAGYLELPVGKSGYHSDPALRRTTRFRATQRLMDLCDEHGINPNMIVPYEDPEIIILRAKRKYGRSQGELVDYDDTPFTRLSRKNLKKINEHIARHHINLDITDEQEAELVQRLRQRDDPAEDSFLDFTKTRLKRIFNNASFEQGGRFYSGWWQQIPGDYRHFITIDDEPTIELDFSGMHFAIMYAEKGVDIPMEDSYALDGYGGYLRGDIKKAFNIIINCTHRRQAVEAIDGRIRDGKLSEELGSGKKLIDAFEETHPLIKDKIASGEGIRGQFVDSQVAEQVMLKGMEIDLCILPIHDGFIMIKQHADVLEGLMHEAIMEVIGHTTYIKPETFDLSVMPHAREYGTYFIRRPDRSVELNGPLEGDALSLSPWYPDRKAQDSCEVHAKYTKKNKERRDREWKSVHGQ